MLRLERYGWQRSLAMMPSGPIAQACRNSAPPSPSISSETAKGTRCYGYYVAADLQRVRSSNGDVIRRVSAPDIEDAVHTAIADAPNSDIIQPDLIASHLRQVTLRPKLLEAELADERLIQLEWIATPIRRRREMVVPDDASPLRRMKSEGRDRIPRAIAQGRAWLGELTAGTILSPDAIASREIVKARRETLSAKAKRHVTSLALSEERLRFTQSAGRIGSWTLDLATMEFVTSEGCRENGAAMR